MKITAKGNSAWLVLTEAQSGVACHIRTRDILAVIEATKNPYNCKTHIYFGTKIAEVRESHIDILRALEVNIQSPDVEPQAEDITQGS